jgi:hypothetical protein
MRWAFLLFEMLLAAFVTGLDRPGPRRLVLASRSMSRARATRGSLGVQNTNRSDRSVTGMCSAAQDSIGVLKDAASTGISTLAHCAQFGKDRSGDAIFVSFSGVLSTCMWFKDCQCLVSSSTCLGGDQWSSVAITDILGGSSAISAAVVQTTAAPVAKSAVVVGSKESSTPPAGWSPDCDTVYSNSLMRSFQTKCQMVQSVWATRIIAGSVLAGVILLVGGVFGLAYFFDQQELKELMKK